MSINQLGDKTTGHSIGLAYLSDIPTVPPTVKNYINGVRNNGQGSFSIGYPLTNIFNQSILLTQQSYILAIANVTIDYVAYTGDAVNVQFYLSPNASGATNLASNTIYFQPATTGIEYSQSASLSFITTGYPAGTQSLYLFARLSAATANQISLTHVDLTLVGLPF